MNPVRSRSCLPCEGHDQRADRERGVDLRRQTASAARRARGEAARHPSPRGRRRGRQPGRARCSTPTAVAPTTSSGRMSMGSARCSTHRWWPLRPNSARAACSRARPSGSGGPPPSSTSWCAPMPVTTGPERSRYYEQALRLAHATAAVDHGAVGRRDRRHRPVPLQAPRRIRPRRVSPGPALARRTPGQHRRRRAPPPSRRGHRRSRARARPPPVPTEPIESLLAELDELVGLPRGQGRGPPAHQPAPGAAAAHRTGPAHLRDQPSPRVHRQPGHRQDHRRPLAEPDLPEPRPGDRAATWSRPIARRSWPATSGRPPPRPAPCSTSALGGTLLIDEAYALARGGENDFGREAIDTLVKFMEDHRDDLAIVVAGYPDEMQELHRHQPGLAVALHPHAGVRRLLGRRAGRDLRQLGAKAQYHPTDGALAVVRAMIASRAAWAAASATLASSATCSRRQSPTRRRDWHRLLDVSTEQLTTLTADDVVAP